MGQEINYEYVHESVHMHFKKSLDLFSLIQNWQKTENNPITLIPQLFNFLTELLKANEFSPSVDSEVLD